MIVLPNFFTFYRSLSHYKKNVYPLFHFFKSYKNKIYNIIYMNKKMDNEMKFTCKICNKKYASYKSRWNHINKFHTLHEQNVEKNVENVENNVENVEIIKINRSLTCEFCNKLFNLRSTKSHHKKTCKMINNNNTIIKIDQLEEKNKELENTINEMKKQFSLIIKEKGKMHHKTLQKINNQLNNNITPFSLKNRTLKFQDFLFI